MIFRWKTIWSYRYKDRKDRVEYWALASYHDLAIFRPQIEKIRVIEMLFPGAGNAYEVAGCKKIRNSVRVHCLTSGRANFQNFSLRILDFPKIIYFTSRIFWAWGKYDMHHWTDFFLCSLIPRCELITWLRWSHTKPWSKLAGLLFWPYFWFQRSYLLVGQSRISGKLFEAYFGNRNSWSLLHSIPEAALVLSFIFYLKNSKV